jgi:hypothetical protein
MQVELAGVLVGRSWGHYWWLQAVSKVEMALGGGYLLS